MTAVVLAVWLSTRRAEESPAAPVFFLGAGVLALVGAVLGVAGSASPHWRSGGFLGFLANAALFALFLYALLARTVPV